MTIKISNNQLLITELLKEKPLLSSSEIHAQLDFSNSLLTTKRMLSVLVKKQLLTTKGQGRGTKYIIGKSFNLFFPTNLEEYYTKDVDERKIIRNYNIELIEKVLKETNLLTEEETATLNKLHNTYTNNIQALSENEYNKELERLAIDLSWKSSQIEGNTYSLLETERLLKEKETAAGKYKDEAIMLLNHKDTLDFIIKNPDYVTPLSLSKIEDIHSILIKELAIDRNIRKRRVGISGTNYKPLDNEYQIREQLELMCTLINEKENIFEKALLLLVIISYIQPFNDGNKRTARIISNAILMHYNYCPLSFRSVDSLEYKKAMLLFYEQNNVTAFKNIFINQYKFAVETYF
jgi:Fic family protein